MFKRSSKVLAFYPFSTCPKFFTYHIHTDAFLLCSLSLTKSMQRLFFLVERCYQLREPVLLVGETGGGKTTVCQLLSACLQMKLHILNCHQYTETSDFIGVVFLIHIYFRIVKSIEMTCVSF